MSILLAVSSIQSRGAIRGLNGGSATGDFATVSHKDALNCYVILNASHGNSGQLMQKMKRQCSWISQKTKQYAAIGAPQSPSYTYVATVAE